MIDKRETLYTIEKRRMRIALIPTIVLISLLWLSFMLDLSLNLQFYKYGIYPLEMRGLKGIIFSPFIHNSAKHLFSNSLPLLVLIWCLYYFYSKIANQTLLLLWLVSGLFTWIIGRDAWHIGASGIVYSLSFFLFFSGIFRRHIPLVAVSLVVAFLYGSNVWNMFPWSVYLDASVSWEGHLSGGVSGFFIALIFINYGPQKLQKIWDDDEDDYDALIDEYLDRISESTH